MYLSADERRTAGQFNLILKDLVSAVESGTPPREAEKTATDALLAAGFRSVDYVAVVNRDTLEPLDVLDGEARGSAVARLGSVRLLDNMPIGIPQGPARAQDSPSMNHS